MLSCHGERLMPGDRHIRVTGRVVAHRLHQPALIFEGEVGPARQLGHGVGGEERPVDLLAGHFPRHVFDAVRADVEVQPIAVVRPCTAGAIEPAVLVIHLQHRARSPERLPRPRDDTRDAASSSPTGSRRAVVLLGERTTPVRPPTRRWRARRTATQVVTRRNTLCHKCIDIPSRSGTIDRKCRSSHRGDSNRQ